jgi:predicted RND superfamily exporter protein
MTKFLLNEAVKEMHNEFSIDDLIEKLILIQSFEEGRQQYQAGEVFIHQRFGQKLEKMLNVVMILIQRVMHTSRYYSFTYCK